MKPAPRRLALCLPFVLAAAMPSPSRAMPPPPPPPCVPAGAAVSIGALRATIAGERDYHARDCAATDLARRGAAAVPAALGLLDAGDSDTVTLGLAVLTRMGPQAQSALPALMERVGNPPPALGHFYGPLYDALSAIGAAARPAIPLLIARTDDRAHRYYAIDALGQLGKYDAPRVVAHLVSILDRAADPDMPLDAPLAHDALREIGKPARVAVPAMLASLERARQARARMHGVAAVRALVALAEPATIVPVLKNLLDDPMLAHAARQGLDLIDPVAPSTGTRDRRRKQPE